MTKTGPDWTAIEIPYRVGMMSIRAIAKQFGISQPAISKHAKKYGWKRNDLAARTQQATQRFLDHDVSQANGDNLDTTDNQTDNPETQSEHEADFDDIPAQRSLSEPSPARARPDADLIDSAARIQADVIREHRHDILSAQRLCKDMIAGLSRDEPVIGEIEADIEEAHEGSRQWKTRERYLRAVARPTRAATLKSLTSSLSELVKLERQCFNLDAERGDDTAATIEEGVKKYEADAAIAKSGGRVVRISGNPPQQPGDRPL